MRLIFKGHDYKYAAEQMLLTLFPGERPVYEGGDGSTVTLAISRGKTWLTATAVLDWAGKRCRASARAEAAQPVSYTHLDVYKRQVVSRVAAPAMTRPERST